MCLTAIVVNETSLDQCVRAGWALDKNCGVRYGAGVIFKSDNETGGKYPYAVKIFRVSLAT